MCGIAGFIRFSGGLASARPRLQAMTDAIAHRGPDAEGHHLGERVAFGHRRLAIIDLEGGRQPMISADGSVTLVFNGEIYNFLELRRELEQAGCVFRTHSDTEVILHGYQQWGDACVARLSGMFALAIWDDRQRRLLLARDRMGKKPLYYLRSADTVAFASDLQPLRAGGFVASSIDPEAMDCYLTLGYVPSPRTMYRDIRKLLPAQMLVMTAEGETRTTYWTLRASGPAPATLDEAADALQPLLDQAVRDRLMSDVPLGAFLSGGVDSSLVVASMAAQMSAPVKTNTIGVADPRFNEMDVARRIAQHLGTDHREFVVEPRAAEVVRSIAAHLGEPVADPSNVPTWYVCQMARRSVTVALSGDGGDEMFGGYSFRYVPHVWEAGWRARLPVALRGPLFGTLAHWWPASRRLPRPLRLKTILQNLARSDESAYFWDLAWLGEALRDRLYAPGFAQSLRGFTPMEVVAPYYRDSPMADPLGRAQYADMRTYMTDDVLAKVDRMSMAHGLEVRAPLMDHRIAEFAASLPPALKLAGGRGKILLRHLARRRLPAEIIDLPKRGFSIPAADWLRGELRELAGDTMLGSPLLAEYLDMNVVREVWQQHQSGARDHHMVLWGFMSLALWHEDARRFA